MDVVDAAACDTQVVPLLANKLPEVPGATNATLFVPLPSITLLAVNVARPVPPCAGVIGVDNELTVALANVMLLSVVTVLPNWIAVLPRVIGAAKLSSSWDKGMAEVAVPNVLGTGMLEPHS
jgi:hypothetical protein